MIERGVYLVGAGVVGRSILQAHLKAGVSVVLLDQAKPAIDAAASALNLIADWNVESGLRLGSMHGATFRHAGDTPRDATIVIESIAERLDIKRAFFAEAETVFGDDAILCSNTSTLRVTTIAEMLGRPQQFCGMHFFMPVPQRSAVEVVRGSVTNDETISIAIEHVGRLGKSPIVAPDSPGFIVNRLLSPYLNQAMLLLCGGVTADRIEAAALAYGMPMSPLELIDTIGMRTTFDAGRVYWQSFPHRIDPAAMLGRMIKRGRFGRSCGKGFYDYENDVRSETLSPETISIAESYHRDLPPMTDDDLVDLLSIPMWIEAKLLRIEGTVDSIETFDVAMRGGLAYRADQSWVGFFASQPAARIDKTIDRWRSTMKSLVTTS